MTWRSHEKWGSSPAKCKYVLTFLAIRFRFFFFTTQLHIFCNYDFSVFSNNACDNCGDNVCTIADTERMDPDLYDEFGNYVWAGDWRVRMTRTVRRGRGRRGREWGRKRLSMRRRSQARVWPTKSDAALYYDPDTDRMHLYLYRCWFRFLVLWNSSDYILNLLW